jgi:hypothetical protein
MQHSPRAAACWALALGLALGVAAGAGFTPVFADVESLAQILARWKSYVEPYRDVPRDIRVPESKKFFLTIPWDNIDYLCREGSPGVDPDSAGSLLHLVRYRLEVGPPPAEVVAAMLESPDIVLPCRTSLFVWAVGRRDSLNEPDRRRLAGAALAATRLTALPEAFRERLYTGAATLIADDSLMTLMSTEARSADSARARLGIRMLASSIDSRAADSLAALARLHHDARSPLLDEALIHCRGRCADLALDIFIATFRRARSRGQELLALEAAARVPRADAAQAILDFYADEGMIADSTFAAGGSARARFYSLWLATRIAEPHLITWLERGTMSEARLAVELLDRSLRFGPADQDSVVVAALARWAERAPDAEGARGRDVGERAAHPPQPGPQTGLGEE